MELVIMCENESIHKKGSFENPFSLMTTINDALTILRNHVLLLPAEDSVIHFKWQGGVYTLNVGLEINYKSGSPHSLETLRKQMKIIQKM